MKDPLAAVASLSGVDKAVDEARSVVDRLLGHRVLRRSSARVSAESALRGARASASLEGSFASMEDIRSGTEDPVVLGALRVSAELGDLRDIWRRSPRQALARLHVLAAAGDSGPDDVLGRPRAAGDAVSDPLKLGEAPHPTEVSGRLDALSDLLVSGTTAPAVVVAAIVHGELLSLRPFTWGNGLVARAAERLTLVDRGLDPKSLTVPEAGYVDLGELYGDAVRGYLSGSPEGVAHWVRTCAAAIAFGAREAIAICEAIQRG